MTPAVTAASRSSTRVQHDPVRPGLHAGAPRPGQRDRRQHAPGHPQQPPQADQPRRPRPPARRAVQRAVLDLGEHRARHREVPPGARPTPARSPATTATAASCCGPRPQRPRAATSRPRSRPPRGRAAPSPSGGEHQRVRRRHGVRRQRTLPAGQQQHVAPRLGAGREQRDGRQRPQQRARDRGERAGPPLRRNRLSRGGRSSPRSTARPESPNAAARRSAGGRCSGWAAAAAAQGRPTRVVRPPTASVAR